MQYNLLSPWRLRASPAKKVYCENNGSRRDYPSYCRQDNRKPRSEYRCRDDHRRDYYRDDRRGPKRSSTVRTNVIVRSTSRVSTHMKYEECSMNPANRKAASCCHESSHHQDDYSNSKQSAAGNNSCILLSHNSHIDCSGSAKNYHVNFSDSDTMDDGHLGRMRKNEGHSRHEETRSQKVCFKEDQQDLLSCQGAAVSCLWLIWWWILIQIGCHASRKSVYTDEFVKTVTDKNRCESPTSIAINFIDIPRMKCEPHCIFEHDDVEVSTISI